MEGLFVQFGVDVCGLQQAVSEHAGHLLAAGSTPDHPGSGCVAKACALNPRIEIPASLRRRLAMQLTVPQPVTGLNGARVREHKR